MNNRPIEERIAEAKVLLSSATELVAKRQYDAAERSARQALDCIESESACADYGDERDETSTLHLIIKTCAWAYNRLLTITRARAEHRQSLEYAEIALAYARRIGDRARICDVLINKGNTLADLSNDAEALQCYSESLELGEELGDSRRIASALNAISILYFNEDHFAQALEVMERALIMHEQSGDLRAAAGARVNIGAVLSSMMLYDKALEYYAKAMEDLESLGDKSTKAVAFSGMGNIHAARESYAAALTSYGQAIALYEEVGNRHGVVANLSNVGLIYKKIGEHEKALEYYHRVLSDHEQNGNKRGFALVLGNIGSVYADPRFAGYDVTKAEEYLQRSIADNRELGMKKNWMENEKELSDLYEHEKRWEEFGHHLRLHFDLKEQVINEDAREQVQKLEQRQLMAAREREMQVEKAKAEAEFRATTSILHKVLPASVATRLINGEKVADYFDNISILFADIVGFTPIAARMPADAVLAFLNYVFGEFDRIMVSHGCQKIKTMGDGYMAVCGAPLPCDDHAERLSRAALDLMSDLVLPDDLRSSLPTGSVFHLRIGLHCGPAFGGIVGEQGFVYDVYSDAVNLASRMESHGDAGRIHCSEDFALHLANRDSGFVLEPHGEVDIKGKGMMKTFFLKG